MEIRLQQRGGGDDPLRVGVGPADVGLELAIAVEESIRVHHGLPPASPAETKNPRTAMRRLRGLIETQPDGPFVSRPVDIVQ